MALKLETLALLVYVDQCGTICGAAKMAHLSQPTASLQIRRLEEDLGVTIFHRNCSKNRLSFTDQGKLVLSYAKQFVNMESEMYASIATVTPGGHSIVVGTGLTVGTYIVPYLVENFRRKFPRIECMVKMAPGRDLLSFLDQKQYQVVISSVCPGGSKFDVTPFYQDEMLLMASTLFDIPNLITVQDLRQYPLILREATSVSRAIIEKSLKKAGVSIHDLRVEMELFSNEAVRRAIGTGNGIGFLPSSAIGDAEGKRQYKIVNIAKVKISRPLNIIQRKKETMRPAIDRFIDFSINGDWKTSIPPVHL